MKLLVYRNGELYLTVQVPKHPPGFDEGHHQARAVIIKHTVNATKNKLLKVLGSMQGIIMEISVMSNANNPEPGNYYIPTKRGQNWPVPV